jgi:hypothetical protein
MPDIDAEAVGVLIENGIAVPTVLAVRSFPAPPGMRTARL